MIRDGDAASYAKSTAEANEKWRRRVKFEMLGQLSDDMTPEEARKKLTRRYSSIRKRWGQTSNDELLEIYLTRTHNRLRSPLDLHVAHHARQL